MTTHAGSLSTDDLEKVLEVVWEARLTWYNIGLGLQISPDRLDGIKEACQDCNECLREMLKVWLRSVPPSPTWKALAKALRSPTVGYGRFMKQF